ncbi:MAG: hypothetical protein ACOX1T_07105 [Saccharofermentanales bacterium]
MAKPIKAATTRISATVTARYNPAAGATDAFYLDGRMNSRREMRAADITLDREDRGFFYAAFAHAGANNADEGVAARARQALDNMLYNMKQTGRNIDSEINELADTAVEVAGRITLQHDNVRQPYFAGVIVRDSELAAITMGGGCAYLYRNNILYPLTTDDYPLEPIDQDGNPVDRLNIYCAGVAGTVRYSNIAQLAVDDCLIVCNLELMEAIGQREILRLLDEAEDQCEAAGMVITAAAAKQPNTSMQFLIGFVEEISAAERVTRSGGRTGFGSTVAGGFGSFGSGGNRPQTASYEPPVNKAPAVESADSTSTDAVDFSAAASSHIKPEPFASAFASKPDDQKLPTSLKQPAVLIITGYRNLHIISHLRPTKARILSLRTFIIMTISVKQAAASESRFMPYSLLLPLPVCSRSTPCCSRKMTPALLSIQPAIQR